MKVVISLSATSAGLDLKKKIALRTKYEKFQRDIRSLKDRYMDASKISASFKSWKSENPDYPREKLQVLLNRQAKLTGKPPAKTPQQKKVASDTEALSRFDSLPAADREAFLRKNPKSAAAKRHVSDALHDFNNSFNGTISNYSEATLDPRDARTIHDHINSKIRKSEFGLLYHSNKESKKDSAHIKANALKMREHVKSLLARAKNAKGRFKI